MLFRNGIKCQICGRKFLAMGLQKTKLGSYAKDHSLCLECAKWAQLSENRPKDLEIIDGVAYKCLPHIRKEYGMHLGGEGKERLIIHPDGTYRFSNDIWTIGTIPERFRNILPNTGWWIDIKYLCRLKRGVLHCRGKMCYDRYHCFRYDYKQEYGIGPYNILPKDHVAGSENCKEFIDIRDITNYPYFNIEDAL